MGVRPSVPVIPTLTPPTWEDADFHWEDPSATWDGWVPQGGSVGVTVPAQSTVTATTPSI